ncbi:MAG: hypothetical protein HOP11_08305, partial [Saprospiraceae bacterium]|nr:hypothetical protein [Saprospiraceae bacterium]
VKIPIVEAIAPIVEEPVKESSNWWKWLLPLLLLAGLLFFLKDCKGCKETTTTSTTTTTTNTTTTNTTTITPPPDPAKVDTPPPPPPAPVCNCDNLTHPAFNLSGKTNPKVITRLGTNPEFGSFHDMTAEQVLAKMNGVAKKNKRSQEFLDGIFKQLGYNGFSDIKSDMISEVDLPRGTVGNIGYSKEHKTLYAQLDNEPRDLMAFKFKGKNGCDIHFMKTCGNHLFFCDK